MRLFKNRMVLGIACIVVSLIICFAITPLINTGLSKMATVVRVRQDVKAGEQLDASMLEEVQVGSYNLPPEVYRTVREVEGMYLTSDLCAGDYVFPGKVSVDAGIENTYLYSLNGEKQAMSITIDKFARGLSGKLKSGDIVSVVAPDYRKSGETVIPQELRYVEVIAVTANSGYDANLEDGRDKEEKELPSTVTLLIRPEQAMILAELEEEGTIHIALVYRGMPDTAEKFIEAQDMVLDELRAAKEAAEKEADGEEGAEEADGTEGEEGTGTAGGEEE